MSPIAFDRCRKNAKTLEIFVKTVLALNKKALYNQEIIL